MQTATAKLEANRRYRNFRFSIPLADFIARREHLMSTWEKNCAFVLGQEECSSSGHQHIELFATMNNSLTYGSARKQLDVPYCLGVLEVDIQREIDYVSKPDTRVEGEIHVLLGSKKSINLESIWPSIIDSGSKNEALAIIKNNKPELYFLKRKQLIESFDHEFGNKTVAVFNDFNVPFINVWNNMTHLFIGPTGIGKTNYALSHFVKPVHITNMQNFNRISDNVNITDGIVIDDIELSKLSAHKVLQLCDTEYEHGFDVKYGYEYIPAMLPRIICLNSLEYFWPPGLKSCIRHAILSRIVIHFFNKKLYDINISHPIPAIYNKYKPRPNMNFTEKNENVWLSKPKKQMRTLMSIEARKQGMKSPLPNQEAGFIRWLSKKKDIDLLKYIDIDKLRVPSDVEEENDINDAPPSTQPEINNHVDSNASTTNTSQVVVDLDDVSSIDFNEDSRSR